MAVGAITFTILGEFDTSGAALKTAMDGENMKTIGYLSGGRIIIVPVAGGNRVQLYKQSVAVA